MDWKPVVPTPPAFTNNGIPLGPGGKPPVGGQGSPPTSGTYYSVNIPPNPDGTPNGQYYFTTQTAAQNYIDYLNSTITSYNGQVNSFNAQVMAWKAAYGTPAALTRTLQSQVVSRGPGPRNIEGRFSPLRNELTQQLPPGTTTQWIPPGTNTPVFFSTAAAAKAFIANYVAGTAQTQEINGNLYGAGDPAATVALKAAQVNAMSSLQQNLFNSLQKIGAPTSSSLQVRETRGLREVTAPGQYKLNLGGQNFYFSSQAAAKAAIFGTPTSPSTSPAPSSPISGQNLSWSQKLIAAGVSGTMFNGGIPGSNPNAPGLAGLITDQSQVKAFTTSLTNYQNQASAFQVAANNFNAQLANYNNAVASFKANQATMDPAQQQAAINILNGMGASLQTQGNLLNTQQQGLAQQAASLKGQSLAVNAFLNSPAGLTWNIGGQTGLSTNQAIATLQKQNPGTTYTAQQVNGQWSLVPTAAAPAEYNPHVNLLPQLKGLGVFLTGIYEAPATYMHFSNQLLGASAQSKLQGNYGLSFLEALGGTATAAAAGLTSAFTFNTGALNTGKYGAVQSIPALAGFGLSFLVGTGEVSGVLQGVKGASLGARALRAVGEGFQLKNVLIGGGASVGISEAFSALGGGGFLNPGSIASSFATGALFAGGASTALKGVGFAVGKLAATDTISSLTSKIASSQWGGLAKAISNPAVGRLGFNTALGGGINYVMSGGNQYAALQGAAFGGVFSLGGEAFSRILPKGFLKTTYEPGVKTTTSSIETTESGETVLGERTGLLSVKSPGYSPVDSMIESTGGSFNSDIIGGRLGLKDLYNIGGSTKTISARSWVPDFLKNSSWLQSQQGVFEMGENGPVKTLGFNTGKVRVETLPSRETIETSEVTVSGKSNPIFETKGLEQFGISNAAKGITDFAEAGDVQAVGERTVKLPWEKAVTLKGLLKTELTGEVERVAERGNPYAKEGLPQEASRNLLSLKINPEDVFGAKIESLFGNKGLAFKGSNAELFRALTEEEPGRISSKYTEATPKGDRFLDITKGPKVNWLKGTPWDVTFPREEITGTETMAETKAEPTASRGELAPEIGGPEVNGTRIRPGETRAVGSYETYKAAELNPVLREETAPYEGASNRGAQGEFARIMGTVLGGAGSAAGGTAWTKGFFRLPGLGGQGTGQTAPGTLGGGQTGKKKGSSVYETYYNILAYPPGTGPKIANILDVSIGQVSGLGLGLGQQGAFYQPELFRMGSTFPWLNLLPNPTGEDNLNKVETTPDVTSVQVPSQTIPHVTTPTTTPTTFQVPTTTPVPTSIQALFWPNPIAPPPTEEPTRETNQPPVTPLNLFTNFGGGGGGGQFGRWWGFGNRLYATKVGFGGLFEKLGEQEFARGTEGRYYSDTEYFSRPRYAKHQEPAAPEARVAGWATHRNGRRYPVHRQRVFSSAPSD